MGLTTRGKTGAAILAADYILARSILVVTPASGRGVWRRAFPAWQSIPRRVSVIGADAPQPTDVCIVSWGMLDKVVRSIGKRPDLIILDEDHEASNPDAKRTQHVYGAPVDDGATSCMLLLVAAEPRLEQVERQLAKLYDVLTVRHRPDLRGEFFYQLVPSAVDNPGRDDKGAP